MPLTSLCHRITPMPLKLMDIIIYPFFIPLIVTILIIDNPFSIRLLLKGLYIIVLINMSLVITRTILGHLTNRYIR